MLHLNELLSITSVEDGDHQLPVLRFKGKFCNVAGIDSIERRRFAVMDDLSFRIDFKCFIVARGVDDTDLPSAAAGYLSLMDNRSLCDGSRQTKNRGGNKGKASSRNLGYFS